jgi:hypothetical protein
MLFRFWCFFSVAFLRMLTTICTCKKKKKRMLTTIYVRNFKSTCSFQGDVIVSFDGVRVGCEGTVPFRSNERIAFRYLISQK